MIRWGALGVGLLFVFAVLWGAVQPREEASVDMAKQLHKHPKHVEWTHNGPANLGVFGTFDRGQLQRGFQVYKEVCSACHSINRVAFRDLADLGYSEAQIKTIAGEYEVAALDGNGEPTTRKATGADKFPLVYANEAAARAAQNGANPPDLSLMTKARPDGTNYLYSLLTGYSDDVPKGWSKPDTLYYNPYFHSINIAMPPPLAADGQVAYTDGSPATTDQYAKDVAVFLTWTAEPKLENRKETGVAVILFLIIMTGLGYLSYRKVWADVKKPA
jgi:ubiquinol-cytochrome c reductase cytochrome c1 subunit